MQHVREVGVVSNDGDGRRDARVQVLTAEVRTLVVGSRQARLSADASADYERDGG